MPEPTEKFNADTHYNRLIHMMIGASLDLELAFKEIKISQNIERQVCKQCKAEFCRCPGIYTRDAMLINIINAYQY